jgi:hypothetical protein
MDNTNEYWIRVKASSGMFSNESVVSLLLANGEKVSIFVDNSLIKKANNGDILLKVRLIQNLPKENKKLVLLPTEPIENYSSRWAEIASVA